MMIEPATMDKWFETTSFDALMMQAISRKLSMEYFRRLWGDLQSIIPQDKWPAPILGITFEEYMVPFIKNGGTNWVGVPAAMAAIELDSLELLEVELNVFLPPELLQPGAELNSGWRDKLNEALYASMIVECHLRRRNGFGWASKCAVKKVDIIPLKFAVVVDVEYWDAPEMLFVWALDKSGAISKAKSEAVRLDGEVNDPPLSVDHVIVRACRLIEPTSFFAEDLPSLPALVQGFE